MKPDIKDQLKNSKINPHEYGRLPMREDVEMYELPVQKQWDKLRMIRKNLKIVDKYINSNKGESLNDWARKTNNQGLSKIVIDKIGKYNNATGGISDYYFNLQNFYDSEEEKYDAMEANESAPEDIKKMGQQFREERKELRKSRTATRKIKMKDLKKEGKGYLVVEAEEPKKVLNVDGDKQEAPPLDEKTTLPAINVDVQKNKKKLKLLIFGTIIVISTVALVASVTKK